jgi:hypothetical protein
MSTDRPAAIALVAGSVAGLVTMALHPTAHDVVQNASTGATNTLVTTVHMLALLGQALVLAGTLALTLRLRAHRDVAVGAYVFFALASVAGMIGAVASGFLAPGVLHGLAAADESTRATMLNALHYAGVVNQTFVRIYVLFSGVAILLWSGAMLPSRELPRALAIYGRLLGVALTLGAASGHLRLDVHGFGLVVLGQDVWMTWAAVHLWRSPVS